MNLQEDQEVVTLNEICRVCLMKNDNMKLLLEPKEDIIQLITKLSSVSNVEIEINDTLPCFLCNSCEEKLILSYDFQQLCQKSHQFLLACLSASSISFKVNSFKPLSFEENTEKSATQTQLGVNSETIISFVDNDGLEKKTLLSYFSIPEIQDLSGTDEMTLKQNQENTPEDCTQVLDNLDSKNDIEIIENEILDENGEIYNENENLEPPVEVEKKTKYKQTMRLPQFSADYVRKIIKKMKGRFFKHIDCKLCSFIAKDSRALSVHMTRLHKKEKERWCLWCNETYKNLKEHRKTVHKDDFKCPLCGKYKLNTGHFMEHLASHSTQRSHVCGQCGKCFISERHLKMHVKTHARRKLYRCEVCSEVFTRQRSLKRHSTIHKQQKCKVCDEIFSSSDEYKAHKCFPNKETKPESETQSQNYCTECNKRVRSLPIHIENFHTVVNIKNNTDKEESKMLCSYCGKCFRSPAKLSVHVRIHTGEMPYKCHYCDKRMTTRIHLVVHERTHTGEKPYVCKFCGKAFAQSSVLNTHLKQHTGKTEECSICHKKFCRASELRQHMRSHTGEKPHQCSVCNQGFSQRSHLVGHYRRHTNERPFKCTHCDKSFKQSHVLRSHIDIHLGRKPYKCPLCPYACRQSYSLKQHMTQHVEPPRELYYKCELCGQCFMNFEVLSAHYSKEHEPLRPVDVREELLVTSTAEVLQHLQEYTLQ